jgi:predicted RNase H-like nuclease (RuvC/YqgF family)
MFSLKNELAQYRTDIKNMTDSKDTEIQHLTAQLHNLLSKDNSKESESETLNGSPSKIQQKNTQMQMSNKGRGIKPTNVRGIKPSGKTGIKPSSN